MLQITDKQHYQAIASAIRTKNGQSIQYKPAEMAPAILALDAGSGGGEMLYVPTTEIIIPEKKYYGGRVVMANSQSLQTDGMILTFNEPTTEQLYFAFYTTATTNTNYLSWFANVGTTPSGTYYAFSDSTNLGKSSPLSIPVGTTNFIFGIKTTSTGYSNISVRGFLTKNYGSFIVSSDKVEDIVEWPSWTEYKSGSYSTAGVESEFVVNTTPQTVDRTAGYYQGVLNGAITKFDDAIGVKY